MRIRWTPPAVADLQSISEYLKEHHPSYRQPTMRKLYEKIRTLSMQERIPPIMNAELCLTQGWHVKRMDALFDSPTAWVNGLAICRKRVDSR